ncbi:ANTAR domain-containing response regulator [Candidatus Magnetaquicoccus inordinatus]|uniref:ANTAR domain-containing response regulator n=1 Tax=Candidatus Magnetaquicoccus inordinatus TaxID=2496818 RepID=UPI00102C1310|nr:ANTAR domain-containing protein [Candidatus Magnetaquicoccus inordinatus]
MATKANRKPPEEQNEAAQDLTILVIDTDAERAAILEQGLVEAGYPRVMTIRSFSRLASRIALLQPDLILIDLGNPDRDTLEGLYQVTQSLQRPIVVFVDQSDRNMIERAIEAGVSSYVVDGLRKERVRPIVEMAIARFNSFEKLRRQRDEAILALEDRKLIERAKGLLMKQRNLTEEQAYHAMRKAAMRENRKLAEIARILLTALQLDS